MDGILPCPLLLGLNTESATTHRAWPLRQDVK